MSETGGDDLVRRFGDIEFSAENKSWIAIHQVQGAVTSHSCFLDLDQAMELAVWLLRVVPGLVLRSVAAVEIAGSGK